MAITPRIREVFGHFQNLNLLALLYDLYQDDTAKHAWSKGGVLCPVAHGMPGGQQVHSLMVLGQDASLKQGCDYAARHLGAESAAVLHFVRSWDDQTLGRDWLISQLEELWEERLADAEAMQAFLHGGLMLWKAEEEREDAETPLEESQSYE